MTTTWWQLGVLETISAFDFRHEETKKNQESKVLVIML
jgi:hypothetical protein